MNGSGVFGVPVPGLGVVGCWVVDWGVSTVVVGYRVGVLVSFVEVAVGSGEAELGVAVSANFVEWVDDVLGGPGGQGALRQFARLSVVDEGGMK